MPWKETSVMDQKIQLVADWLGGDYRKSELCRIYEISRPTADKWIARYEQRGLQGLRNRDARCMVIRIKLLKSCER